MDLSPKAALQRQELVLGCIMGLYSTPVTKVFQSHFCTSGTSNVQGSQHNTTTTNTTTMPHHHKQKNLHLQT
ncbi:hypothetical protein H920_17202 [Fukomys damarensis]|uniref:Uncharacterized protein n=1 Tax=Fukomys damarensis TaxID=885580 RepID=A0A091CTW6_FUKDA|nr:hypothetical protein H920_17202 [Fukomys damarensis]